MQPKTHQFLWAIGPLFCALLMGLTLQAQALKTIKVRMGDVSVNKVPFLLALDEGLYQKHGVRVDMVPFSQNAAAVHRIPNAEQHARENFEADISVGGGAPTIVGRVNRSEESDRVVIASTDHIVRWHVIAREGIDSLEDLKGKRIAYSGVGACSHYINLIIAERMGWDPRFDWAMLGGDYSIYPLKEGRVDAFVAYEVPYAMALKEGVGNVIADLRPWNEPIPCSGVNASRKWAHENREAVLGFLKGLVEAIALMKKDPHYAYRTIEKWYGFQDIEVQQKIYQGAAEMPRKPYPTVEGIKRTMELYDSAQMRLYEPEDLYDASFIRELDESGFIDSLYED